MCWLGKLLGGIGAAQHRRILNKDLTFKTQLQCTGNVYMWLQSACKHAMHLQCSIQTEQYIAYYTTRKYRRLNCYTHSILYVYQLAKAYAAKMSCIIELLLHESTSKATADPLHIQSNPNDVHCHCDVHIMQSCHATYSTTPQQLTHWVIHPNSRY